MARLKKRPEPLKAEDALNMSVFPPRLMRSKSSELVLDPSRLLLELSPRILGFSNPVKQFEDVEGLITKEGLSLDALEEEPGWEKSGPDRKRINHTAQKFWVRSQNDSAIDQQILTALWDEVKHALNWAGGVYRTPGTEGSHSLVCPLPKILLIKPGKDKDTGDEVSAETLDQYLSQFNLKPAPEVSKYLSRYRYYTLGGPPGQTVYPLPGKILEDGKNIVADVRFDFMPLMAPTGQVVGPPNAAIWNLTQIGATAGGPSVTAHPPGTEPTIVVAVIDEGCDLQHPELKDRYYPSGAANPGATFDFTKTNNVPNVPITPGGGAISSDTHGTHCAGIIRSLQKVLESGGTKIDCRILPIRVVAYNTSTVTAAIDYAAQNDADVISMSFGGDVSSGDYLNDSVIDEVLDEAVNRHNVVICAATMNDNKRIIHYPAAHPSVIACGASNRQDARCDQNDWGPSQGSNYGDQLSVVAPGVDIHTTTHHFSANAGGDFIAHWGGTSAATPHVAALAAMLMFEKPDLTPKDVRDIIESTADKVNNTTYDYNAVPGKPGWNEEMGFGRINVTSALNKVKAMNGGGP